MFDNEIDIIKSRVQNLPKIAVVLGSGLGELGERQKTLSISTTKSLRICLHPAHRDTKADLFSVDWVTKM